MSGLFTIDNISRLGHSRPSRFQRLALIFLIQLILSACAPLAENQSAEEPSKNDPREYDHLTPGEAWKERVEKARADREVSGVFPEVRQRGTDLFWLRCPARQRWLDGRCAGELAAFSAQEVERACPEGYRVPAIEEMLLLLGDCDRQAGRLEDGLCRSCFNSPSCNRMFGDDRGWYWSSPGFLAHGAVKGTWSVSFDHGYVRFVPMGDDAEAHVRCVRGKRDSH